MTRNARSPCVSSTAAQAWVKPVSPSNCVAPLARTGRPASFPARNLNERNLGAWEWRKPTLIVFDYALSLVETLRVWLEELCAATPRAHPLRILLLERQSARHYIELANQIPEAFRQNATIAMSTWLSLRRNISWEEAFAMLQQGPQTHIDALFDDPDESSPSDTSTLPEGAARWT